MLRESRRSMRWPLRGGPAADAERWRLRVPARWEDLDGPSLELEVLRLKSVAERPAPPILILAGGPGMSGIEDLSDQWPVEHAWIRRALNHHDVVAFDQRGTGASEPFTSCGLRWEVPLDRPGERDWLLNVALERARTCRAGCEARGVDLGALTTPQSVGDIDALCADLGAERVILLGASYGSHLGLAAIRDLGDRIDRAIFALVEPLAHTYKLPSDAERLITSVAAMAAADPAWGSVTRDLRAMLAEALDKLEPTARASGPEGEPIGLGRWDAQLTLAQSLGSAEEIALLPQRIAALASGDHSWLAEATAEWRRRPFDSATAWHVDAASGASGERVARIRREATDALLGDALGFPFPEMADAWGNPDLGEPFRASFRSSTPVLFVSGTLDGRTPPSNVEDIVDGFDRAAHIVVDGLAHDVVLDVPDVADACFRFLAGGDPGLTAAAAPFRLAPP
jgi:pimeloyl-ACP methyl ester carboxylesterase